MRIAQRVARAIGCRPAETVARAAGVGPEDGSRRRTTGPAGRALGLATIRPMATARWDRAALVPVRRGEARAEILALPAGLLTVDELFTFMRDAERRFETLRMRIEERTYGARGEQLVVQDVAIRHPGQARVVTTTPGNRAAGHHEVWISDGEIVRTYVARQTLGTSRPVRNRVRGLDARKFPGPVHRLRADHRPADRDAARAVRPSGRVSARTSSQPVRAGSPARTRSPAARRSSSNATTHARSSGSSIAPTTTCSCRSTGSMASSPGSSSRSAAR